MRGEGCGIRCTFWGETMSRQVSERLKKALALPAEARAALAGSLPDSLDKAVDPDAEALWEREIARRIEELDSGKARTVPWTIVRRRIEARLAQGD